ncbi:homoserine dehydrogenase [Aneurinibacillus tyrosinisolvens]|uniref:homoserine dehydrogenase n=1 Tax=Aneurinibacillus tyrosinisolvens TaxID=1443435 RepID=UPI00069A357F|nr:homoserine dehydrogenase [Aneurinibacillus tyrosinisolvens]
MKKFRIVLLGLGTVGSGVVRILQSHAERIKKQAGGEFEIAGILVRNPLKERNVTVDASLLTMDFHQLIEQPVDIVIDAMGGLDPTLHYVESAIQKGCHVISANKELLAAYGAHLHALADEYNVSLLYEASVGGGIPILNTLSHLLKANRVTRVHGILNGTTNYILSKMEEEGLSYDTALKQAQEKGFAEADPTADVEGFDAANKITIISHLCFGTEASPDSGKREGITTVTGEEIALYKKLGYRIKLIATAVRAGGGYTQRVVPALLPLTHALAGVKDEYNGVFVTGDIVGDLFFTGRGAGSFPTGSAIVEDMINAVQGLRFAAHPTEPDSIGPDEKTEQAEALAALFILENEAEDERKTRLLSFLSSEAGYLHAVETAEQDGKIYVAAIIGRPNQAKIESFAGHLQASLVIRPVLDDSLAAVEQPDNALV